MDYADFFIIYLSQITQIAQIMNLRIEIVARRLRGLRRFFIIELSQITQIAQIMI